ncbi:MAG: hypothetical protein COA91_01205 [Robiginitomaculum sp.]|nr:MAG: hypothetical protein COA91_01205 [Robiginitomaculum sp.]
MTTSTNENAITQRKTGGALADGLTLVRALLTPVIMFIIIKAWSPKPGDIDGFVSLDIKLVLLASFLFAVAAVTDILDDYFGGSASSGERQFGWIDDIADSALIAGTLLALVYVANKAGALHWTFAVPVAVYIGRDVILALTKGYEMSKFGLTQTRLGDLKSALAMLATCILVAAPWLSGLVDTWRAGRAENIMQIYDNPSTWVWNTGLAVLWIAALLALVTGWKLLRSTAKQENQT